MLLTNQGKMVRWHQTLKKVVLRGNDPHNRSPALLALPESDFLAGDWLHQIASFVDQHNHQRDHDSIYNLTPADVYFGLGQSISNRKRKIR